MRQELVEIKEKLKGLESAIEMINDTLDGKINLDDLDLDAGYIKQRALALHDTIRYALDEDEDGQLKWAD